MPFLGLAAVVAASDFALDEEGGGSDEDSIKWGLACTTSPTVLGVSVIVATYKIDDGNDDEEGTVWGA
jgi:hypothetical protein